MRVAMTGKHMRFPEDVVRFLFGLLAVEAEAVEG
jgi:hypothetical protein